VSELSVSYLDRETALLVRENLYGFEPGEGHLYRIGRSHYVVFTTRANPTWDVVSTDRTGTFGSAGGGMVVRGASSRRHALRLLEELHGT
jgi:hypothetical protein